MIGIERQKFSWENNEIYSFTFVFNAATIKSSAPWASSSSTFSSCVAMEMDGTEAINLCEDLFAIKECPSLLLKFALNHLLLSTL